MRTDLQELSAHSHGLGVNKKVNILNTCRLCTLTGGTRMEPIFQVCIRVTVESSVAEKIASVTQLSLCEGDGLPTVVCQQCLFQLDVADTFIQRCKQSDSSLRSILTQEGAQDQGAKGTSRANKTSIPGPLAGHVNLTAADQPLVTAPNVGTSLKKGNPNMKDASESKLIPPPLSSKHCSLPEPVAAEPVAAHSKSAPTEPVDILDASHEITNDSGCGVSISLEPRVETQGDQTNPSVPLPCTPQQSLAGPVVHAQRRHVAEPKSEETLSSEQAESRSRAREISLAATRKRAARKAAREAMAAKPCVCYDCGVTIDGRTQSSRHICRTYLTVRLPRGSGLPSPRVQLKQSLLAGQLRQLQMVAAVELSRLPRPNSGHAKAETSTSACGSLQMRNYRHEQRKVQLLHEMLALKRMRQRLQARLAPPVEAEERETVKLTQLKFKLQSKLQLPPVPTAVVCSPDVSVHLGIADSGPSDADAMFVQVKVEPGVDVDVEGSASVDTSQRRTKRRLMPTESLRCIAQSCLTEGVLREIKTEPESEEGLTEETVDSNANQCCRSKKTKLKQSA